MKNAFDVLIVLIGVFFVAFTAMLDKGATVKVAVVALAVFVGYKLFFAKQVEEEHVKYHAKKVKKKSGKRKK